jgi:hypothetical protein
MTVKNDWMCLLYDGDGDEYYRELRCGSSTYGIVDMVMYSDIGMDPDLARRSICESDSPVGDHR